MTNKHKFIPSGKREQQCPVCGRITFISNWTNTRFFTTYYDSILRYHKEDVPCIKNKYFKK
jgi:hypothetical protein